VSFTLRPLYPQGKSPRHPLGRRQGGSQRLSGHCGVKKKSFPTVNRTLAGRPARIEVNKMMSTILFRINAVVHRIVTLLEAFKMVGGRSTVFVIARIVDTRSL
jgi:hypothetical protein